MKKKSYGCLTNKIQTGIGNNFTLDYVILLMRKTSTFTIFLLSLLSLLFAHPSYAFDSIELSVKIANSLKRIQKRNYRTVAFSRIRGDINKTDTHELIDYTNVSIVKGRRFRVIDRSKLQRILQEQQYNLSDLIPANKYKELGKLLGVDLFIYGRVYEKTLILKAIDVEKSVIVWAEKFSLKDNSTQSQSREDILLNQLSGKIVESLRKDISRLKTNRINQIGLWNIQGELPTAKVADFISVALTKDGNFQVIDRENLELILKEQKLNRSALIDEAKAKKMGELYGIDAFIYGNITRRNNRYIASFKMMNIYSGVLEWAELISLKPNQASTTNTNNTQKIKKNQRLQQNDMVYIPAGNFVMGSNQGYGRVYRPKHQLNLRAFYIDRTEVSNEQYQRFVRRYRHRIPPTWYNRQIPVGKKRFPVVMVNYHDATRYCRMQKKRLPKEAEWEKAFRGTKGRKFPWPENYFRSNWSRTFASGIRRPLAVDYRSKDKSTYGALHMAGNVREWVSSVFKAYPGSSFADARYYRERVIRGGSWARDRRFAVGWYRSSGKQTSGWRDVGFRCAKSAN
ncbi:MAG: sulfatase activating formylglycine-generating enzyme [bacterium]|jgi:formylglycine-generating enzyme required for sulfatase activity/curli biogenesis system outer membrane secretion channel CsgG